MDDEVTQWLQGLALGDESAVQHIWERYCRQLVCAARKKLGQHSRREADEEDVALSAFHSFCRGVAANRFPRLNDRHDLWKLMLTITGRKVTAQVRRERRLKRGGGIVRGESAFFRANDPDDKAGINQALGSEPTPEFAAEVAEQCEHLLNCLPDESFRGIARYKLEGYSNMEIAQELDCTPRTVERKLAQIRTMWRGELDSENG